MSRETYLYSIVSQKFLINKEIWCVEKLPFLSTSGEILLPASSAISVATEETSSVVGEADSCLFSEACYITEFKPVIV